MTRKKPDYPTTADAVFTRRAHICFTEEQYEAIKELADREFGGQFSACVRQAMKETLQRRNRRKARR